MTLCRGKKGFGLPAVLLFLPLLLLMLLALFLALTQGSRWTGRYQGDAAATYVAEAGAAHALQMLKADPRWVGGFEARPMSSGHGQYTIAFNQTQGNWRPGDSVNNFDGEHGDSYLGPNSVPSGAALLSVSGRVGAYNKRACFLVGTGDNIIRVQHALLANGRIKMRGPTRLRAVESIAQTGELAALIQSNQQGDSADVITWNGNSGEDIVVEGEVKAVSSSDSAVNLSGYVPTGGIDTNASQVRIPPAGIEQNVMSKRGAAPFDPASSVVPGGDNYNSGNLVVNGDLILEGDLYVEGDLEVNGSITGNGSVYVTGDSALYGDAKINAKNRVALHSHGHVTLKGFDGDRYLDGIASDNDDFGRWLTDARWATGHIEELMVDWETGMDSPIDVTLSVLAPHRRTALPDPLSSRVPGREGATLLKMREYLEDNEVGPTRDFMLKKLETLQNLFEPNVGGLNQSDADTVRNFDENGVTDGIIEAANDIGNTVQVLPEETERRQNIARSVLGQFNYDRLGASYFQGLIYTNGAFYADNQVTVLGAVVVNDDESQEGFNTPAGQVDPGDLLLRGGSSVTYVKDFFFGPHATGTSPRRILLHMGDG